MEYINHLFIVDKYSRRKMTRQPLQQICTVVGFDVDQHTFGQNDCRNCEVNFRLFQFVLHLVQIPQIQSHYVIVGRMQIGGIETHLAVCVTRNKMCQLCSLSLYPSYRDVPSVWIFDSRCLLRLM